MTDQHDDETERQRREAEAAQNERRAEAIRQQREQDKESSFVRYVFMTRLETAMESTLESLAITESDPARLAEMGRILDQWNRTSLEALPKDFIEFSLDIKPENDLERTVAEALGKETMRVYIADTVESYRFAPCMDNPSPLNKDELPFLNEDFRSYAEEMQDLEDFRASGAWMEPNKTIPLKNRTPEEQETVRENATRALYDLHDDQQRRKAFRERENQDRQRPEQERQARERAEAERQRKAKEEADRAAFLRAFDQRREAAKDKGQDKNHHRTRDR